MATTLKLLSLTDLLTLDVDGVELTALAKQRLVDRYRAIADPDHTQHPTPRQQAELSALFTAVEADLCDAAKWLLILARDDIGLMVDADGRVVVLARPRP